MRRRRPDSRSTLGAVEDFAAVNKASWDERVPAHAASPDYGVDSFIADPKFLSAVVRFDLPRLGHIAGLRGVHLQCHIGTDTISLARLGASMTGVDFSGPAIRQARALAEQTGADATFIESDVDNAADAVGRGAFDFVFTGIGALCWLPSIARWAAVVAALLRPGGRLFIREGHPMLWTLADPRPDGLLVVEYPYFETSGTHFSESFSYVAHDTPLASPDLVSFNHGLAEVITALLDTGMTLQGIVEHNSVPWNPLGDAMHE